MDALEALERLLRDFAMPLAKVSGERLLEFGHHWDCGWKKTPPMVSLVPVLDNWEEVLALVVRPGQRFKGTEVAAICIQSCWRGYLARTALPAPMSAQMCGRDYRYSMVDAHPDASCQEGPAGLPFQLENYRRRAQVMVSIKC